MEKTSVYSLIIALIRSYYLDTSLTDNEIVAIKASLQQGTLFSASKYHDIAHLVGIALDKNGLLSDGGEIAEKFHNAQAMAFYRYERLRYDQAQLFECLEKNAVPFIPLKGAVLREFYPEPWLRTSCDIDVLVHECDLESTIELLKDKLSYTTDDKKGSHEVSLYTQSGTHIELHFTLYESMNLDEIWNLATPAENKKYHYLMSNEIFYCHQIAHIAKHFVYSGCGIRMFLDIWFLNKAVKCDEQELSRVLNNSGVLKFAQNTQKLVGVWFSGDEPDEITQDMEDYIFKSGIYGNIRNKVLINQRRMGSKFKYAMDRIFPPLYRMAFYYPSLNKYKFLLPVFYVARLIRLVFNKNTKGIKELRINNSFEQEKQDAVISLMNKLDLM